MVKCPECRLHFRSREDLDNHFRIRHPPLPQVQSSLLPNDEGATALRLVPVQSLPGYDCDYCDCEDSACICLKWWCFPLCCVRAVGCCLELRVVRCQMQNRRTILHLRREKADLEDKVTEMNKNFEERFRRHESELSYLRSQIERQQAAFSNRESTRMDCFEPGEAVPIFTNNQNADFTSQFHIHIEGKVPFGDGKKRNSLVSRESLLSLRPATQIEPPLSLTTDCI